MADSVSIYDKTFVPFIKKDAIASRVKEIASAINTAYKDKNPLFLGILNGAFIFAADLFRGLIIDAEISFIKLASYKGTSTTGHVVTAIGLEESLKGRHVIIIEDIIDTGKTLSAFLPEIYNRQPASVAIAVFLTKPGALKYDVKADYTAFEIEDKFVVGYGLDYDGYGRNLPDLYQLA